MSFYHLITYSYLYYVNFKPLKQNILYIYFILNEREEFRHFLKSNPFPYQNIFAKFIKIKNKKEDQSISHIFVISFFFRIKSFVKTETCKSKEPIDTTSTTSTCMNASSANNRIRDTQRALHPITLVASVGLVSCS